MPNYKTPLENSSMLRFLFFISIYAVLALTLIGCSEHDYNPTWTSFEKLSQRIAKQYHQRFLSSGTGLLIEGDKAIWAYSVMETRNITLDEAKILTANMLQTTLDAVLPDPLYQDYFPARFATDSTHPSQIGPEYFGFKVSFWDEKMDRPLAPYIAQIRAVDGWVHFYYADPKTQALQEPAAEIISYENLLHKEEQKAHEKVL